MPAKESNRDLVPKELDLALLSDGPLTRQLSKLGIDRLAIRSKIICCIFVTWVPVVALCWWQGVQTGTSLLIEFLRNFQESARFLLVTSLLLFSATQIRPWITHTVRYFVKSGLIPDDQIPTYIKLIENAQKARDSIIVESALLLLAIGTSVLGLTFMPHGDNGNWRYIDGHLSMAAYWFKYVSMPLYRFMWLTWLYRIGIWWYLLLRISMLKLKLVPTHPDCRGGLGFIASGQNNFAILAFAMSSQVAAVVGEEILYHGHTLDELKVTILLIIFAISALGVLPLIVFTPKLIERKRLGLYHYGILAKHSVDSYHHKWVKEEDEDETEAEQIETDPKAQDNFKAVGNMQVFVFDKNSISVFVMAAAAPFAPLLLTIYRFDQLLDKVLKKLI